MHSKGQWQHINPITLKPITPPNAEEIHLLLADAISVKPQRYGQLEQKKGDTHITTTGVELTLDWNTLSISQQGNDTRLISTLYKIHYLQWLGHKEANKVLGIAGLVALALMVYYGLILYLRRRKLDQ